MPYYKLFYHASWSTKDRAPFILPGIEPTIETALDETCSSFQLPLFGVGFAVDHIHVAFGGSPTTDLSKLIGRMKGSSSHAVNASANVEAQFRWQREYGILSITERALPDVLDYFKNQRTKHEAGQLIQRLERFE